jgi:hypothetical protein
MGYFIHCLYKKLAPMILEFKFKNINQANNFNSCFELKKQEPIFKNEYRHIGKMAQVNSIFGINLIPLLNAK